jgi:arylsulfatase A-like enzyme
VKHASTLLALAALLAAGCSDSPGTDGSGADGSGDGGPRPRNLVWISLDTLRADRLGCYGYERPTSPAIDALALEGTVFDDASSTAPWTKPAHASLFTGLYPSRNGVVGFENPLSGDVVHVAELFARSGFQTLAVVSNSSLTLHGLERGFEGFDYIERGQGPEPSEVTQVAIERLRALDPARPFFALVHYNGMHARYRSLPRYEREFVRPYEGRATGRVRQFLAHATGARRFDATDVAHLSDLYDAALRQLDDQVQGLLDHLRSAGLLEETLLVLTSDHGEEFFDHGEVNHGLTQYQELVRVPLIVRGPGVPAGLRVDAPVSLIDLMPTSLALLGVPVPAGLDGVEIQGLWSGEEAPARLLHFEASCAPPDHDTVIPDPGTLRAVRRGTLKLHHDPASGRTELYDLARDPTEEVRLATEGNAAAAALLEALRAFEAAAPDSFPEAALTDEDLRRLQDLGYVQGGD